MHLRVALTRTVLGQRGCLDDRCIHNRASSDEDERGKGEELAKSQRRPYWRSEPSMPVSYTHLDVYKRQNVLRA